MFMQKRSKRAILGSIAFMLIYVFVAAVPLSNDFYFQPEWTKSILGAAPLEQSRGSNSEMQAFMLGDNFGFFTQEGEIFRGNATSMRFSAGGGLWSVYPENALRTQVHSFDGSIKMTVGEAGFVHLTENGIYLFHPGGNALSKYSENGSALWRREEIAPITAFSDSAGGAAMGYANGLFAAVDNEGNTLFSFYPSGSDYQVVLGAAISQDARFALCISGINPQRVILVEISGSQYRITAHQNLANALTRQAFVAFSTSGRYGFFETKEGLGILDAQRRSFRAVELEGQILNVVEYANTGFFAVLSKKDAGYHSLSLVTASGAKLASVDFECRDAFLLFGDESLYLGSDNSISKINIVTSRGRKR